MITFIFYARQSPSFDLTLLKLAVIATTVSSKKKEINFRQKEKRTRFHEKIAKKKPWVINKQTIKELTIGSFCTSVHPSCTYKMIMSNSLYHISIRFHFNNF